MTDDRRVELAAEDEAHWWRERGERELRQLLFWRWDPIGVQDDLPYSEGEYDEYAPQVVSALHRGAGAREIAALLASFEESAMEIAPSSSEVVAELIVGWYDNSRRYWREFDRRRASS